MRVRYVKWLAMTASVATGVVGAILLSRSNDSTAAELIYSSEARSAADAAGKSCAIRPLGASLWSRELWAV